MDQRIINLYDRFTHGDINRRAFLEKLSQLAGSTAAALALLPLLQNDYARAAIVPADDARLVSERVAFESPKGKISGYLTRLKGNAKRPAVLVIHENRGLNPHLEDVARRLALDGFLAYAIDLLSLVGGTPPNEDEARDLHPKLNQDDALVALVAAVDFLKTYPEFHRQGRRGRVLLRRVDGQSSRGGQSRRSMPASPITGDRCRRRRFRTSRRRCCCIMPRTMPA